MGLLLKGTIPRVPAFSLEIRASQESKPPPQTTNLPLVDSPKWDCPEGIKHHAFSLSTNHWDDGWIWSSWAFPKHQNRQVYIYTYITNKINAYIYISTLYLQHIYINRFFNNPTWGWKKLIPSKGQPKWHLAVTMGWWLNLSASASGPSPKIWSNLYYRLHSLQQTGREKLKLMEFVMFKLGTSPGNGYISHQTGKGTSSTQKWLWLGICQFPRRVHLLFQNPVHVHGFWCGRQSARILQKASRRWGKLCYEIFKPRKKQGFSWFIAGVGTFCHMCT